MEKRKFRFILLASLFLIINISIVYAQGSLGPIFENLENMGLIGSIAQYPFIWDAILFITIFIGLGRSVLGPRFNNPAAGGMIGFALSVIMISGELTLDFSITRDFGPWFLIAGVAFLTFFLLKLMISDSENRAGPMGLIIFIFLTMLLNGFPQSGKFIADKSPLLFSLLTLFQFIGLVFGFIWIFKMVSNLGGASAGSAMSATANAINEMTQGRKDLKDAWRNARGEPDSTEIANLTNEINDFQTHMTDFDLLVRQTEVITRTFDQGLVRPDAVNLIRGKMNALQPKITTLNTLYVKIQENAQFINLKIEIQNKFNNLRDKLINPKQLLERASTTLEILAELELR